MNTKLIIKEMKAFQPCKSGFEDAVKNSNLKSLCDMFFSHSDWTLKQNFPNKNVLEKYRGYYEQYGIFYRSNTLLKGTKMGIFDCDSELNFNAFDVSEIYIRGNSKIKINATGYSKIFVTVLDDSEINVTISDNASVNIFRYGGNVVGDGEVKQCRWS